ncbi:MAG: hypothetical protein IJV00_10815, partial [Clostridia bacterium]|nr:hypothetical protein [Clostridia bacterium]
MLVINIPADGISLEVSKKAGGDLSEENCRRTVEEFIDRFIASKPDAIFLNVCYRRALFDSDTFDSILYDVETDEKGFALKGPDGGSVKKPNPPTVTNSIYFNSFFDVYCKTLLYGTDLLGIAAERIKKAGCRLFVSVRMNDAHYTENPSINSHFSFAFGKSRSISSDGALLDYSLPAVKNHYLQFILECINRYDPDGIELDWLRHWTVLPEKLRGDFSILSDYMAEIRNACEKAKKGLRIAVRVPSEPGKAAEKGMDPARWIADGSADVITIENHYVPTNFEMPVAEWRRVIAAKNTASRPYVLLCGSDWGVSCLPDRWIPMNPPLVRGFAREAFERGADGIYLFNFFETGENAEEFAEGEDGKPVLRDCFDSRLKAAGEPFALPRRYVCVGENFSRYPIT